MTLGNGHRTRRIEIAARLGAASRGLSRTGFCPDHGRTASSRLKQKLDVHVRYIARAQELPVIRARLNQALVELLHHRDAESKASLTGDQMR
jgi:hypothetical protein